MEIKVIKTENDYNQDLKFQKSELCATAHGYNELGDEDEVLSTLIEKHEDEFYPMEAPDPIELRK